jgi:Protein of unknown function (DUF2384).
MNDLHEKSEYLFQYFQITNEQRELIACSKDADYLHRLSMFCAIHERLTIIFNDEESIKNWLHKNNRYFDDRSALSVILESKNGLLRVLQLLQNFGVV